MNPDAAREERIGSVIGAVVRQMLSDWGVRRIALLDDGSPEAEFVASLVRRELGPDFVVRVTDAAPGMESLLRAGRSDVRREALRFAARLLEDAVPATPCNKTALLLGGPLPPEPLLPLGDLYASEVAGLAGGWSASPEVRALADGAGGVAELDAVLRRWAEGRDPAALDALPTDLRGRVVAALHRGQASRLAPRTVPKLGTRTLGLDLFE